MADGVSGGCEWSRDHNERGGVGGFYDAKMVVERRDRVFVEPLSASNC